MLVLSDILYADSQGETEEAKRETGLSNFQWLARSRYLLCIHSFYLALLFSSPDVSIISLAQELFPVCAAMPLRSVLQSARPQVTPHHRKGQHRTSLHSKAQHTTEFAAVNKSLQVILRLS